MRLEALYDAGMSRIHDVGGQWGFGPVEPEKDEPPFHAEWEARVFALNLAMLRRGAYNLDEFRHAIERMEPDEYLRTSYYERWLGAIERLLDEKGLVEAEALAALRRAADTGASE